MGDDDPGRPPMTSTRGELPVMRQSTAVVPSVCATGQGVLDQYGMPMALARAFRTGGSSSPRRWKSAMFLRAIRSFIHRR